MAIQLNDRDQLIFKLIDEHQVFSKSISPGSSPAMTSLY